jgi:hypothetical protein
MTPADGPGPDAPRRGVWFVLEPHERVAESLFGLIMVLTFTGSLSIAEAGRDDVRAMLVGALGCNLAWGVIDGVLYLMGCLAEKGRDARTLVDVHRAADPQQARDLITGALPLVIASVLRAEELDAVRDRLKQVHETPARVRLERVDWAGALEVFGVVFLTTLPVVVPFLFMRNLLPAMRVSNAIAVGMLFIAGLVYGRCIGRSPWLLGLAMVVLGALLSAFTMALGG